MRLHSHTRALRAARGSYRTLIPHEIAKMEKDVARDKGLRELSEKLRGGN